MGGELKIIATTKKIFKIFECCWSSMGGWHSRQAAVFLFYVIPSFLFLIVENMSRENIKFPPRVPISIPFSLSSCS